MKPQPRPRRKAVSIPKAAGPDPAALTAEANDSRAGNAGNDSGTSGDGRRGSAREVGRLSIRMDADMLGRARSAWRAEAAASLGQPYRPFGQWVADLIEQATLDAEARLNGGAPFTPTPPGEIPYGRPGRQ
ncbi:hypothetical protein [Actinomyces procaprae]|uniref:hypothetical protein n=1 Tax=Actinomyces procaprae TaxID=2560010 RepID=UPI00109D8B6B|nr:hypothetical protein [Actinomyces procaprae]